MFFIFLSFFVRSLVHRIYPLKVLNKNKREKIPQNVDFWDDVKDGDA